MTKFLLNQRAIKKKAVSFSLALALSFSAFPAVSVQAATYTVTTMAELTNRIANSSNGDIIVIGNDITAEATDAISSATISNRSITIDGNGHTVDFNNRTANPLVKSKEGGTITLKNATFKNLNSNFKYSNGVVAVYKSKIVAENCAFINNRSIGGDGGGALSVHNSSGSIEAKNSTFYQNSSSKDGGAIYSSGKGTIVNSTFVGNSASGSGGALRNSSSTASSQAVFYNSIAVNNSAANGDNVYRMATDGGYNILGSSAEIGTNATSTYNVTNAEEWMELEIAENSGTTPTFALKNVEISPAIDRIPDMAANLVHTDQRGIERPQGLAYDIGAYEYKNSIPIRDFLVSIDNDTCQSGQNIAVNYVISGEVEGFDTKVGMKISAMGEQDIKYFTYEKVSEMAELSSDGLQFNGQAVYKLNAPSDYAVSVNIIPSADTAMAETLTVSLIGNPNAAAEAAIDSLPGIDELTFEDTEKVTAARTYVSYILSLNGNDTPSIANYGKLVALEAKLLELQPAVSSMSELLAEINRVNEGETVKLSGNIVADASSMITVTKSVTIDGNGYYIDGNGKTAIFYMNKSGKTLTLKDLDVQNAYGSTGSVLYVRSGSALIDGCQFTGNTSTGNGGAVYAYEKAALTIKESILSGNKGNKGGAVSVGEKATVTIENSALFDNIASGAGGAIGGITEGSKLTIVHCTIVANQSGASGGGIAMDKNEDGTSCVIYNSIVTGNRYNGANNDIANKYSSLDKGHNLIGTVTGTAASTPSTSVRDADFGASYTDWMYGGNGYQLKNIQNNPAVDKIPSNAANYMTADLLGVARGNEGAKTGTLGDIGAYELVSVPEEIVDAISSASLKMTDMNGDEKDTFDSGEQFIVKSLLYYTGNNYEEDPGALFNTYFDMDFAITGSDGLQINGVTSAFNINTENPAHFGSHGEEYAKFAEYIFALTSDVTRDVYITMSSASVPDVKTTKKVTVTSLYIEINKDILQNLIDEAKALSAAAYTAESWKTLQAALSSAEEILSDENATQNRIDDAAAALQSAIDTLQQTETEEAGKTVLQALAALANMLAESDYTEESWEIVRTALESANDILVNEEATQDQVDEAVASLQSAIAKLKLKEAETVNKSLLQALVNSANTLAESEYTEESWESVRVALESAYAILADEDATQEQVNAAGGSLQSAITGLRLNKTEEIRKAVLQALINIANTLIESDYTSESWEAVGSVLVSAYNVLLDEDVIQSQVDEAASFLQAAIDALQFNVITEVNKAALWALISSANALTESGYTADSWQRLQEALLEAASVSDDESATQESVNHVAAVLTDALERLTHKTPIDKTSLNSTIISAEGVLHKYYTDESRASLQSALANAKAVYDHIDAKQGEIDEAKAKLQNSVDALVRKQIVIIATAYTGGTITPSGSITLNAGSNQTFTVAASSGYKISDVTVDGVSKGAITQYTFSDVTANAAISAIFELTGSGGSSGESSSGGPSGGTPSTTSSAKVEDAKTENTKNETMELKDNETPLGSIDVTAKFTDIKGHWAEERIRYVITNGIFSGTGETTFSPDMKITRGMFVTIIGKLAKIDTAKHNTNIFSDVNPQMYYAGYINWAQSIGIVNGAGNNMFAPEETVTREQMAVILYNYMKYSGMDTAPAEPDEDSAFFADDSGISQWAKEAVYAMRNLGYITGKGNNVFDAKGTATRAEAATLIVEIYGKNSK